jgi:hypothetical protein
MARKKTPPDIVSEPSLNYGNNPPSFEKVWLMFQETDRKFKESEHLLSEKFQETKQILDEKFQETDRQFRETDKRIKNLNALFTSQWGKLIESLVEGDLVKLLCNFGVPVNRTSERVKGSRNGEDFEFDILAHNGDIVVVVEVKTTLRSNDVADFKEKMKKVKIYLPEYANDKIIGAMAYLTAHAAADKMAMKDGFIVIRATGNSASIKNNKDFVPFYY